MQQFRLNSHLPRWLRRGGELRTRAAQAPERQALAAGRLDALEDAYPGLLSRLTELFLEDSVTRLSDIADGLSRHDVEKVRSAAHALKGSAANLGASRLAAVCDVVERRVTNEDVEGARASASTLAAEFERARAALLARCG